MSGLFDGGGSANTAQPSVGGLRVQTTVLGRAIPWVFGTARIAPNLVQYDDFTAIPESKQAGGKGGGGQSVTSYTYRAAVIMALCGGPITGIGQIWATKEKRTAAQLGLDVYTGTDTQNPHPHWATNHAASAVTYRGLSYLASAAFDLGTGGDIGNHNVEVITPSRISSAVPDARVDVVVSSIITDKVNGLGLASNRLGDLSQAAAFCLANGIWVSPAYVEQQPAVQALQRLADIAQSAIVWSDGKLKLIPYSDTPASGNGATYTPSADALPVLGEDDFLPNGSGPALKLKRLGVSEVYNHHQIKYRDRSAEYNDATVEAKATAHIERFGLRTKDPEDYVEICTADVAQKLANWRRDRAISIRTTYEFKLSVRWDRLEPADIVLLTYAPEKLVALPVRILSIEEDENGDLSVVAEDCPLGAQHAVTQSPQTPVGGGIDYNASPGNAAPPVIFEAPLSLTGGTPEIWIGTSGAELWGGCEVWVSPDGATYQRIASITSRARHGTLTAPLPVGGLVDTANTLAVSLATSRGALSSGSAQDATDLNTLCWVDGELLAYRDATLTGINTYGLQYLVRGAAGTDVAAHAAGAVFMRCDEAVLHYAYDKQWIGRTINIKLTSHNIFGSGEQSLADVPAYSYLVTGAPLAGVQNLALLKPWTGTEAQVKWDLVDGAVSYDVEAMAGRPLVTVRSVSAVTSGQWTYAADDARADGGPWRSIAIRVRPRAVTGKTGPWRSITASNPQIGALSGLSITGGIRQALFQCARPVETDFAGLLVWVGTSAGFVAGTTTLVYDGPDTFVTLAKLADGTALAAGTTYYLRAAGYDEFGKDGLTLTNELTFTVAGLVPDVGSIIDTMLADGAITRTKFAQGLEPVSVVTSPTLPTVKTTETITWGGKLYAWDGTAYTNKVPAVNITGQLTDAQLAQVSAAKIAGQLTDAQLSQISAAKIAGQLTDAQLSQISATKLAGQVTNAQIAAVDAAKMTGQITGTQITDNAISTPKIAAGAVTAATIAAGAIVAGKIAAQAITTAELSAGAVTAQNIAAGAVTAGKIAAQAVTAAELSAGAVQAQHVAAGAIVAGKIAAGAVTATELAAGSVLAGKLAAGAVVAGTIAAGAVTAAELSAGAVTATKIAAGAVTANSLAVNSVTAAAISAGAVRADQIAAGSIRAEHLLITSRSINLDPTFSQGAAGWGGFMQRLLSSDARVPAGCPVQYASQFSQRDNLWLGVPMPCVAGEQYRLSMYVNTGGGVGGGGVGFVVVGYNKAGNVVYARGWGNTTAPGWQFQTGRWAVPAGVTSFNVGPWCDKPSFVGNPWFADLTIEKAADASLIVDGSITAAKILAGEVQTQHLVANAVTADKIVANSITADKIAVGAVQAQHISSGLPGGNLIPNSALAATFIDSGGVLQADGHTFAGANIITSIVTGLNLAGDAWRPVGMNALSLRQLGTVGAGDPAAYADIGGPVWAVVAGQPYEFSFFSGAHRCSVTGYVTFRNAAGTIIWQQMLTTNAEEAGGGQGLDGYKRLFTVAVAPAGAVTGQLSYRKLATVAGASDSWLFAACPMGAPALSAAQSAPSPWVPAGIGTQISGGIIKTGTVTADRIGVSQLSAISANLGSINAGSLNINNRFIVAADGSTTIRSATSGQRTELDNQQMRVYDAAGVMRVRLGTW